MLKIQKLIHPLSGSTTSSSFDSFPSLTSFETSDFLLEEFVDEIAHVDSFLSEKVDDLFDFEDNNDEWRNILYHDPFDDIQSDDDDDLFDLKSDNDEWKKLLYGDNFNDIHSEKDKIKDSKMKILIDELETPESNVLLPQNEDKVFNPGILVYGNTHFVTNEVTQDKNLKEKISSGALLILEERNFLSISSDQKLLFHLELTVIETLLSFSSEYKDKVFHPGILTSKGVHSLTLELSHRTYETFKIVNVHPNILNEGPMKTFLFYCFCPKDKRIRGESS
ncbi:hypothetical protein Tco_1387265 [Tanacetum coccineum]